MRLRRAQRALIPATGLRAIGLRVIGLRATGRRAAGLLTGVTIGAVLGCSTVDRGPIDECEEDSDCGTGLVCSLAQGNICVPEELPPRAAIGLDIKQGDLRVELTGCDPEVSRELGGSELRVQPRSELIRDYDLTAATRRSVASCGECLGVCDEQALTCTEAIDADLTVTMASRLGRAELRTKQSYLAQTEGAEVAPPIEFLWPIYEADSALDPLAHAARVLDTTPTGEGIPLATYRRVLAEGAPEQLDSTGVLRCHRGLFGNASGVRIFAGAPVVGANIEFRYADPIATPASVLGPAPSCSEDQACPPGWACNVQGSCGLDLTDTLAGSTISTAELDGGYPPAWVYTYCEGTLAPVDPLFRGFTVTVNPPTDSGLPTVLYSLDQGFVDPPTDNSVRQVEVQGQLCLPDWQPPQPVGFSLVGEPVRLATTELGEYRCCATSCLPTGAVGVDPPAPPTIDTCNGFERARFETRWFNPFLDNAEWLFAGCVPTASYPDGANGRFRSDVDANSCEAGQCAVGLTPGSPDDVTRTYTVAITQPVGSVFQSQRVAVQIDAQTSELPPFELRPRVLLRGEITCATTDNCTAENAVIAAERLRVDTDDPDLPGPFFFEARVDATGQYVLPLDPGVYVVTALPAVGQAGAPAPFVVVDLRDGSDEVEQVDGTPSASLSLQLDDGVLVRVALDGFEVPTGVSPIDIGSWKAQDDFPADLYDLNDPQTCYSADTTGRSVRRGCVIRRLRPTEAPISMLVSKRIQFTARSRGGATCE